MFEHHLHLPKIGDIFLDGVSLSDLIWTYVVTGAYCLVQGRVWRFHRRNKERLDPLSGLINLITPGGKQQTYVYNTRGVMEICWFSTHPGGFSAFKTDIELVHSFVYICLRAHIRKTVLTRSQGDFKLKPPLEFKRWFHGDLPLHPPSRDHRPYILYIS